MANQEALLAEYSAHRQEILQADQKMWQFVGGALAVASVGIVFGFQAQNSLAFLGASFILLVGMYHSARSINTAVLVGTYLYAIVEPKVEGLQWETMLAESRKMEERSSFLKNLGSLIVVSVYLLFTLGCVLFAWLFIKDYRILNVLLYSCITVVLVVFFAVISFYALRVSSNQYRSDCIKRWKKIEKDLSPPDATIRVNS